MPKTVLKREEDQFAIQNFSNFENKSLLKTSVKWGDLHRCKVLWNERNENNKPPVQTQSANKGII